MTSCGKNIKQTSKNMPVPPYAIILGTEELTAEDWKAALNKTLEIQQYISDQVYISRKKDFDNPFRHTTFRNKAEMKAAIGSVEDNSFILQVRQDTEKMAKGISGLGA